ncbi:uncharacterized protein LOC126895044 isoform X2 [Daktulosphaira vitifoliae]|uniref:uncharacterized protein LOC126895044 isoform X2 n=1 Tax=Daktulosphaira vitifoliae TaxID=58002 RepID=UPI0021AA7438|nr:uncharacterized protein LOC126895044 isoform X2 [Daktulosphaira vitifoliae]
MEMAEDISDIEPDDSVSSQSFGDISRISASISVIADDYTYDPTAFIEISDILGLVGKSWNIHRVSPLWNLNLNKKYLDSLSKKFTNYLRKHVSNSKNKKNSNLRISASVEIKEAFQECIALQLQVISLEDESLLYTGVLLKSPDNTNKKENNLLDLPVLLVQGSKPIMIGVHSWLAEYFDCVVRHYEFAPYEFLWLIAISMGDAGQLYNETILYHYHYGYELSKGQMDIKFFVESEFLRSTLAKLNLNRTTSEATSFHYSDLIKVQSEIEDYFKFSSGINASKLRLKAFEAPKVATINMSGKIHIRSSTLMDLILKYLLELENRKYV